MPDLGLQSITVPRGKMDDWTRGYLAGQNEALPDNVTPLPTKDVGIINDLMKWSMESLPKREQSLRSDLFSELNAMTKRLDNPDSMFETRAKIDAGNERMINESMFGGRHGK